METHSLEEFNAEAVRFVRGLQPRKDGATVVALSGDLGAGKTTYVQAIARELGVDDHVASPTFVLEKVYQLNPGTAYGFERLIHIDAYRLKTAHELDVLGWYELVADPTNLIFIEWAENVSIAIPETAHKITLEGTGDARTITIV